MSPDGHVVPHNEHLDKLFMRKPGLPILKVRFPDGSCRPYWNTFYQEVVYHEIAADDLLQALGVQVLTEEVDYDIEKIVNDVLNAIRDIGEIDLVKVHPHKDEMVSLVELYRKYLRQMDMNAQ